MKLSQIKHAINESKKMVKEAEEEFGGDNFDQFLSSIKEIEKHARERRVLEPNYSKEDLISDIKREIPDIDEKLINKMADFVFGHLGESAQVTEAQTAEELEVGEPVKITGNVQFQGATGVIDSFGIGKRFVIVDLGEHGLHSFHSSDVSFNAEEEQDEFEGVEESTNPQDTITMDVPLFIRTLEFAREDAKDDMDLHDAAENALKLSANGDTLTMDNYDAIVPSDAVEEAGPGFVDVTGWSARDVQRLGHEDDDYEEPRRNHGYGYNRPAAKPVLSGYYFYNVSPADENDATAIGLKKTKSGKWALAVYNTSGRSTTMKKQSADRAFGPGRWWAPKTESVEQGVAEGSIGDKIKGAAKSIKRVTQGWGVGGAPDMVTPAGAVKAFKDMDGQRLANFVASRKELSKPSKGSARAFADKVIDREMKQRGYGRVVDKDEQGVAEGRLHNPGVEDSPVAQAITRRVLLQRTDLLAKYGPGFVGQAIDDVADSVGAVDEIGSSDVSGWVKQVEWNLKNKLNQYDEPMNMDEASDISGILGAASMVKDYIITAEVDGTTKKFRVRGMTGPRAAKERFLKHAAYAKVLDVKPVEEKKMNEVTLGDYRKKAAMQKAQSQMGAMFARSPEEREKNTATFYKRERGLNRLKARDEAARKAEQERQLADTIARLPELKAEYERMRAEYKSLGGSNWQYADREQNLSDSERKARAMEGPMNNLWRQINAAEKAQGSK